MPSVNRDISFKERQQASLETNDLLEKILKALQHQNKLLEAMQPEEPATVKATKTETKKDTK